jgi:hypothetical protein
VLRHKGHRDSEPTIQYHQFHHPCRNSTVEEKDAFMGCENQKEKYDITKILMEKKP